MYENNIIKKTMPHQLKRKIINCLISLGHIYVDFVPNFPASKIGKIIDNQIGSFVNVTKNIL